MPLPWVRLDSNIATHDKVLALLADPSPKRWQAAASYMFALGWSGGAGTDGWVPSYALGSVHGTAVTARLLTKYQLWVEGVAGWQIHNYADRQETSRVSEEKRVAHSTAAAKANCVRWHGSSCWHRGNGCSKERGGVA